jgi:hypothetical protein
VVSDVAAAIGGVESNARAAEYFGAGEQVGGLAVAAQRDDVRVFEQQELVGDEPLLALGR